MNYYFEPEKLVPWPASEVRRRVAERRIGPNHTVWSDFGPVTVESAKDLMPSRALRTWTAVWGRRTKRTMEKQTLHRAAKLRQKKIISIAKQHMAENRAAAAASTAAAEATALTAVAKCPQCQCEVWDNKSEQSSAGCVGGLAVFIFIFPAVFVIWAAVTGTSIFSRSDNVWPSVAATAIMVCVAWFGLRVMTRRDHFRRCRGCGYSYPVK